MDSYEKQKNNNKNNENIIYDYVHVFFLWNGNYNKVVKHKILKFHKLVVYIMRINF